MPATEVGNSDDLLAELSGWVKLETPTTDGAAVNRLMDVAEAELARAGAAITRIPGRDGFGDNLIARTPGEGKPVLVAGHLDTVWSHGTLETMPYVVNGTKAHGPGIYDMKAGSFLAFHAVRSILQQSIRTPRPDRAAADAGRGSRQPDQPLADRAGGGAGGDGPDPGTGRRRGRLCDRTQRRWPIHHAGRRPRLPRRQRVRGRRLRGRGVVAPDHRPAPDGRSSTAGSR